MAKVCIPDITTFDEAWLLSQGLAAHRKNVEQRIKDNWHWRQDEIIGSVITEGIRANIKEIRFINRTVASHSLYDIRNL